MAHHLQGDETPIEVSGKAAISKSYMWVARTPIKQPNPVVYYIYGATRRMALPNLCMKDINQGVLQCDGYNCGSHQSLPQSRLGKAITYVQSRRFYLDRIINDGAIDWSNNASESTAIWMN